MFQKITLSLLIGSLIFTSCVSSKKYKASTAETLAAKTANEELTKKNSDLQSQVNDAVASAKLVSDERDRLQTEAENAKQQLKQMQSTVDEYNSGMDDVQKKTADRLADYAERGADVQYKDGMVYVTLQDDLLFKKGTNKVSKTGETVLGTLASVLSENNNLKVSVLGHTDDRAGSGGDKWTTSTERANNVVRMLKTMKLDPNRLTSAGQGQYNAVGDNATAEGRAQNKRTEIILSGAAFPLLKGEGK